MSDTKKIKKAYVFIDGNNLYHNVKKVIKPSYVDFVKLSEFVCSNFGYERKLSIYYNSVPSIDDGQKLYYDHMKFLDEVTKLPNFVVKTRKLQRHPTKDVLLEKREKIDSLDFCDNCQPLVETMCHDCIGSIKKREKGIDVMIAVDMIDFCLIKNECDCCILISGDADFIPALDSIKNGGKDVATAFISQGYSYEIRARHKNLIISKVALMDNCLKNYKAI